MLRLREHCRGGGEKIVKATQGGMLCNAIFWTWYDFLNKEFPATLEDLYEIRPDKISTLRRNSQGPYWEPFGSSSIGKSYWQLIGKESHSSLSV